MTNPTWPGSLPQYATVPGYKETYAQGAILTQMEEGPPKMRRRFTALPKMYDVSQILDTDQVDTLFEFWKDTCAMGATRFDWVDFRDRVTTKTYSFMPGKEPQVTALGGRMFTVSFSLLQWP